MKYKLNGEDIEAIRYTGGNLPDVRAFAGRDVVQDQNDLVCYVQGNEDRMVRLGVGEWLVKCAPGLQHTGAPHDFWSVPDDRFRRTFVPIEEGMHGD